MRRPLPARRLSVIALGFILLAACAAPTASPTTTAPVAGAAGTVQQKLTVFAAASLTESFTELGEQFEAAHPGVTVLFNFAGSQQLRGQLEQGAQADVFASANNKEMNAAVQSSLVISGTQTTFARNRLVVIFPKDNPARVATLADLAKPGLKLVVADKAVPVGQYTLDMLARMSQDPAYGADFEDKVQKNMVSHENDVKFVVAKVRLGEADAGVVYSTDVTAAAGQDVTSLAIPDPFNQLATYPIAALAHAPQPELAQAFIELILSEDGQQVLASYGFIPREAGQP